jgi:hypothetical protein
MGLGGCSHSTVGFAIFYYPIISMINEWWIMRRGRA